MQSVTFNRRGFLLAASTLPFALRALAEGSTPGWVLLGTDKGKGIYRARWNAATGERGPVELAIEAARPDFFARHPKLPVLYSVNSVGGGKGAVSSFRIDERAGSLTLINTVSSHGDGPCFVSVDASGRAAFVANYSGGSFAGYLLRKDGALEEATSLFDCHKESCGPLGPVSDRQEAAHLHCATLSPDNHFVLVCDLGDDAIQVFPVLPAANQAFGKPTRIEARKGSGPRHVAFHPSGKWVYCVHELDATIDMYRWQVAAGKPSMTLVSGYELSTLAPGTPLPGNTGCEILASVDGRFLYACSRGVDEITVYAIDPKTGLLKELERVSSGGKVPRYIALDPSGRWLVCCNQGAGPNPVGNVTVFARDATNGRLASMPRTYTSDTPMFVSWI